jgi:hypothetical protein
MAKKINYKFIEDTNFEYVNEHAEVVIVGITPGNSQTGNPSNGIDPIEYKKQYAFAGSLRKNLIKMLNFIGVNRMLGIESCDSLWKDDFDKVEMTSLLKRATYRVKKDGKQEMFKDVPTIFKDEILREEFERGFRHDCARYSKAKLYVACGKGVYEVLQQLQSNGVINRDAKVVAIAHPSSANSAGVSCYLEKEDSVYIWSVKKANDAKRAIEDLCITVD